MVRFVALAIGTALAAAAAAAVAQQTPSASAASAPRTQAAAPQAKAAAAPATAARAPAPRTSARPGPNPGAGQSARAAAKAAPERTVRRPSEAMQAGLHRTRDPLALQSSVALVVNQDTEEVLFEKNAQAVLPIASITKLMTAIVTVEAGLPLDEELVVTPQDRTIDRVRSQLRPGVRLRRGEALHLALMASENHAAQLLGRTYPGGVEAFVDAMNAKAQMLGMHDTEFADPTGLSPQNRSSPRDLVRLVKVAYDYDLIRDYSTSSELALRVGPRIVRYGNTNRLTTHPDWEIGLQKTGFISAAGRCLVMQSVIDGQRVVMVLLDSFGRYSRLGDAQRIRQWLQAHPDGSGSQATRSGTSSLM